MEENVENKYKLSDDKMEQVSGGFQIICGYAYLTSLDGITVEDCPEGFYLDDVKYTRAYMTSKDANGNIFEIYCSEGHMVLIPTK